MATCTAITLRKPAPFSGSPAFCMYLLITDRYFTTRTTIKIINVKCAGTRAWLLALVRYNSVFVPLVHPIHARVFSIQMLLHFSQIVSRVCTLVLLIEIVFIHPWAWNISEWTGRILHLVANSLSPTTCAIYKQYIPTVKKNGVDFFGSFNFYTAIDVQKTLTSKMSQIAVSISFNHTFVPIRLDHS